MCKNKFVKILVLMLSVLMLAVGFVGCKEDDKNGDQPPETYVISALKKTIALDEDYQLSIIGLQDDDTVVWASNNVSVATVNSNGVVTGVGVGKTAVVARVGSQVLECEIIVSITLDRLLEITLPNEVDNVINLSIGDTYTFAPELSNDEKVNFTLTSNSEAVSISGLTVTAVSVAENVAITVTCNVEGVEPLTVYITIA